MFLKASGLWVQGYQELRVHRGAHLSPSNRCALFQRCSFRGSVNAGRGTWDFFNCSRVFGATVARALSVEFLVQG